MEVNNNDVQNSAEEILVSVYEEIKSPSSVVVQHQMEGNTVKMLIILESEKQQLITFNLPNEDCTVQDLLNYVIIVLQLVNYFIIILIL